MSKKFGNIFYHGEVIMTEGILYIAYNKHPNANHIKEAIVSAKSIKAIHPDIHITLFTDVDPGTKCFDTVKIVKVTGVRLKQVYLYDSPYDRTLFLDSDTKLVNRIDGIFDLLDRVDMAAALDHVRKDPKKSRVYSDYANIPDSFSEFNSGVILFKKSPVVKKFFEMWRMNYKTWCKVSGKFNDQPSFRVSLWQCVDLRLHTLPPEFNIRTQDKRDNSTTIIPRVYHWHDMFNKSLNRVPQRF
jgi:lipopolysaccharide biosynthesis glycosyltransferase